MAAIAGFVSPAPAKAGEVRTLSMYHVHTGESLTVTYKVDGRYIPAALDKINYLLRDWRKNAVIRIDPKTIDLMWELHEDLGSKVPVNIVCGYRSAETNAFLSRIGRNVARRSQHIQGKAIDLYFPDVSTEKIRNSALVRQIGGVGFYPRSGLKGFVHIDSGSVRHWPYIPEQQIAQIMHDYRSTIGARMARRGNTMVAALDTSSPAPKATDAPQKITGPLYSDVPTPRPRPIEVAYLAAQRMQIVPASAPVPHRNFAEQLVPADLSRGWINQTNGLDGNLHSNVSAKGSLVAEVRQGIAEGVPLIRPIEASASAAGNGILDFLTGWFGQSADALIRQDGYPQPMTMGQIFPPSEAAKGLSEEDRQALQKFAASPASEDKVAIDTLPSLSNQAAKADMLVVNRAGKGDFGPTELPKLQDKLAEASVKAAQ